jgi:hypothetical protein
MRRDEVTGKPYCCNSHIISYDAVRDALGAFYGRKSRDDQYESNSQGGMDEREATRQDLSFM